MNVHAHAPKNYTAAQASGVCVHSSPCAFSSYVIFCVGQSMIRQFQFRSWALENGVRYKSLFGYYEGEQETSFITNIENLPRIRRWIQDQRTILVLSPLYRDGIMYGTREASLAMAANPDSREVVGPFTQVSRDYALAQIAYTYDPANDTYWVAE